MQEQRPNSKIEELTHRETDETFKMSPRSPDSAWPIFQSISVTSQSTDTISIQIISGLIHFIPVLNRSLCSLHRNDTIQPPSHLFLPSHLLHPSHLPHPSSLLHPTALFHSFIYDKEIRKKGVRSSGEAKKQKGIKTNFNAVLCKNKGLIQKSKN